VKIVHESSPPKVGMERGIHHQQAVMGPTSGPCALGHDGRVKTIRSAKPSIPAGTSPAATEKVQVLVADSGPIQSQLLTRALKSRRDFQVSAVALEASAVRNYMQSNHADVVLIAGNHLPDFSLLHWLRVSYPKIAPVLLAESDDRQLVVNAFRAGAKGIFLFTQTPLPMLCRCIL
jgi:PleD family two-component response regulator